MLVSAMMTSLSIAREKELGTMEALLVSPLKPFQIIVGKVIPYVFLSFINLIVILLLARFVFLMPFRECDATYGREPAVYRHVAGLGNSYFHYQ